MGKRLVSCFLTHGVYYYYYYYYYYAAFNAPCVGHKDDESQAIIIYLLFITYYLMPNSHRPPDKIRLSCLCRVRVCIESARQVSSASECVRRSHRAARHTSTQTRQNAPVCLSDRLNSHSHIRHGKTVLSVSCLARQSKLALIICYACSLETLKENFRLEVETKTGQIFFIL